MRPMPEAHSTGNRLWRYALLAAAATAVIAPFCHKALHIDDPLFVWAAQQIAADPLDFYGFDVNWYSTSEPMWQVTQNPPLACYYLAIAGSVSGWSEPALHLAMLLPAWAAIWGTFELAIRFGAKPLPAALMTLTTPVFVISATTVMCDVLMLALWLWTIVLWHDGLVLHRPRRLWIAGLLIGCATLTKYFGICLLPLLAAYSIAIDRGRGRMWSGPLVLAAGICAGYQVLTWLMYGRGLLGGAMGYAFGVGQPTFNLWAFHLTTGLAFLGGCVGLLALTAPFLVGWRGSVLALAIGACGFALIVLFPDHTPLVVHTEEANWRLIVAQYALWTALGACVLMLIWNEYRRDRTPASQLLLLWIAGTLAFAVCVNWTINGRSILPAIPAIAIVIARRTIGWPRWIVPALLVPALGLSLIVALADCSLAGANRAAADRLSRETGPGRVWFSGHWGFQYYMMQNGAWPWDPQQGRARAGDWLIEPVNASNTEPVLWDCDSVLRITEPTQPFLATMQADCAAGFYSDIWGPLPFVFAKIPPEGYHLQRLRRAPNP